MSSTRDVRDLLDRAAEGPVGPPPIAELVGRGARRRRTWQAASVGVTAAVTAVVIVIVVGIAGRSTPVPGHRPTPGQHSIGPVGRGPTASQIAHGTWQNLPVPPIKSCGFQSVTSTGNLVILVVSQGSPSCPNAAAAYDPRTNVWTKLSPPPASLRGDLTSSQDIFVSRTTRAAAVLNPRSGTWRSLPAVPASGSLATLVVGTSQPILIGTGPRHDQVFAFDGTTWASRPALPHPGTDIVALSAYSEGETQWALASEEHATPDGFAGGLTVLRFSAQGWTKRPDLPDQPLVVQSVELMRTGQLLLGNNCLPNASCPQGTPPRPRRSRPWRTPTDQRVAADAGAHGWRQHRSGRHRARPRCSRLEKWAERVCHPSDRVGGLRHRDRALASGPACGPDQQHKRYGLDAPRPGRARRPSREVRLQPRWSRSPPRSGAAVTNHREICIDESRDHDHGRLDALERSQTAVADS